MTLDFHWVHPQIAVGACFAPGEEAALKAAGVDAVVDLRDEDRNDAAALAAAGVELLHLPTPDMHPPRLEDLDTGVAFVRARMASGERVLIHCRHGIGRSATLALCALAEAGVTPLDAITAAKDAREKVSPSPEQYEGWKAWLAARGLEPPDFHTFGCIAYRHLADEAKAD